MDIRVGHSPDSDDAFMFYALAENKLETGIYRFEHRLEDIETLNRRALAGEYEVTALSFHAYAHVADRYLLLPSGASMGDRYGPVVVSSNPNINKDLRGMTIAIPGKLTTACLVLRMFEPDFRPVEMAFDRIPGAVSRNEVDAGLLIHEGQLTYAREGLHKAVDLGEWWFTRTGLPLPLGGNGIRRDLGPVHIRQVSRLVRESIQYALDHRQEALAHALKYARGLGREDADRFVSMYVNNRTLDYGDEGRKAVRLLLEEARSGGHIPEDVRPEFAD
jgi:1,4-dihydroxy-6-naphthoate synthase